MQLVYGRDAVLNTLFEADWQAIKQRKQALINKNNARENKKRTPHTYKVGDKILLRNRQDTKYGNDPYSNPVQIVQVNNNGTIRYTDGTITDTINIRNIHPYFE